MKRYSGYVLFHFKRTNQVERGKDGIWFVDAPNVEEAKLKMLDAFEARIKRFPLPFPPFDCRAVEVEEIPARGNPARPMRNPLFDKDFGLRLLFLPVNQAWGFFLGSTLQTAKPFAVEGRRLFPSRKEAIEAAFRESLIVDAKGIVTTKLTSVDKRPTRNPLFDHEWYVAWNDRTNQWQAVDGVTLNVSAETHARMGTDQLWHDPRPIRGNRRNAEGAAKKLNYSHPRGPHVPPPTQGTLFAGSNPGLDTRGYQGTNAEYFNGIRWEKFSRLYQKWDNGPRDQSVRTKSGAVVWRPRTREEKDLFQSSIQLVNYLLNSGIIRLPDEGGILKERPGTAGRPFRVNPSAREYWFFSVQRGGATRIGKSGQGPDSALAREPWKYGYEEFMVFGSKDDAEAYYRARTREDYEGNPARIPGAPVIYGRTESIRMMKTSGPYKGQKFVHKFGPGVRQHGFPPGTRVLIPAGKRGFRAVELTKRTVLLERPNHNLWNRFK